MRVKTSKQWGNALVAVIVLEKSELCRLFIVVIDDVGTDPGQEHSFYRLLDLAASTGFGGWKLDFSSRYS